MRGEPRGPTTEELRARVLAQLEADEAEAAYLAHISPGTLRAETAPFDERGAECLGSAPESSL